MDGKTRINIDDGEAWIDNVQTVGKRINTLAINLTEEESLDERYAFTHTVTFTTDGYSSYEDFVGEYYVVVEDYDGTKWLLNPMFPCKVTYTYTLDSNGSRTDFTLGTISNHPMLQLRGLGDIEPYQCKQYKINSFESLEINYRKYSKINQLGEVVYTNEGFYEVDFNKGSQSFTEVFDGNGITQSVTFDISFDSYKSSWHYNLLEFTDNRYSVVIKNQLGGYVACGFGFGLQPSYTVYGDGGSDPSRIEIRLTDYYNSGEAATIVERGELGKDTTTTWENVITEFACIGKGLATYVLKEEVDILGNHLGRYSVLDGFQAMYADYNIVSVFYESEVFASTRCRGASDCEVKLSLSEITSIAPNDCKEFSVIASDSWELESSTPSITVSPTKGNSGVFKVSICALGNVSGTLTLKACDSTKIYNIVVGESGCLPTKTFNVTAQQQNVTIPSNCCITRVFLSDNTLSSTIGNGYFNVSVTENSSVTSKRSINVQILFCDNTTENITIIQDHLYERWASLGEYQCEGGKAYEIERRYIGYYENDINIPTSETRRGKLIEGQECDGDRYVRWSDYGQYTCVGGDKFQLLEEEYSYDGKNWTKSGATKLGNRLQDTENVCGGSGDVQYEWRLSNEIVCESLYYQYRWQETDGYICQGTTKYKELVSQYNDGSGWKDVEPRETKIGDKIEDNSTDCGYFEPQYRWQDTLTFVCDDDYNKYQEQVRQVSNDGGKTWNDVYPRETQNGALLEENSTDCGYIPPTKIHIYGDYGIDVYVLCNDSNILTLDELIEAGFATTTPYYALNVEFGDCIDTIGENALYGTHRYNKVDLVIPSHIVNIGDYALSIGDWNSITIEHNVEYFGKGMFKDTKNNIQFIKIPQTLEEIPEETFMNVYYTPIPKIPEGVKRIGKNAYRSCKFPNDYELELPNSLVEIGDYAFSYNYLERVVIPDKVERIGEYAFFSNGLNEIVIGESVKEIGEYALGIGSDGIDIIVKAKTPPTVVNGFASGYPNIKSITVPCGAEEAYKQAEVWSRYADVISAAYTEKWVEDGYECVYGDKYALERKYKSCNDVDWIPTDETRQGRLIESESNDCSSVEGLIEVERNENYHSWNPYEGLQNLKYDTYFFDVQYLYMNQASTSDRTLRVTFKKRTSFDFYVYSPYNRSYSANVEVRDINGGNNYTIEGNDYWQHIVYDNLNPNDTYVFEFYVSGNRYGSYQYVAIPSNDYSDRECEIKVTYVDGSDLMLWKSESISLDDTSPFTMYHKEDEVKEIEKLEVLSKIQEVGPFLIDSAFKGREILLGDSVRTIVYNDFINTENLEKVTLSANFNTFRGYGYNSDRVFVNNKKLREVIFKSVNPPTNLPYLSFIDNADDLKIYVPSESVDAYKQASGWSTYADRIFPIP